MISAGGGCTHLLGQDTFKLTMKELIDLIDAQPNDRICVQKGDLPVCAEDQSKGSQVNIPKRGASIIMPAQQWGTLHDEVDQMCRMLGDKCTYQMRKMIDGMKVMLEQ